MKQDGRVATRREVSTLVRLPPPLRGRVGERGEPRALTDEVWRSGVTRVCHARFRRGAL